jgi:peroxiredoxin
MANPLTGDYEAVVEIAVRQINGLLATLHQNGAADDAPLKLLHSAIMRVGDPHPTRPSVGDFGDWVFEFQRARAQGQRDVVRGDLVATAPPGAARLLSEAFAELDLVLEVPDDPPDMVRGTVKVQLSSPTISVPAGSASQVTVHAHIRAHYYPDDGTNAMPEPLHGEVQATFDVRQVSSFPWHRGKRLVIQASSQDSQILFIPAPGTGLSATDVARISAQVRKAVRESFTLLPVDLPPDFAFSDFKGLGTGPGQALALPIKLSGPGTPSGNIQSVTNLFIGPSGFAVAVSKEYVMTIFQPTLDRLRQIQGNFTVKVWPMSANYHYSVTNAELQFNDGSIDLIVKAKATTDHWNSLVFSDYNNIVITQRLILHLFLGVLIIDDDELTISGAGRGTDTVRTVVTNARGQILPETQNALNRELSPAKTRLDNALGSFDSSASASFRAGSSTDAGSSISGAIAITPDGVIVRGDIGGAARPAAVIAIAETEQRQAFTALQSWIPAGRIDRLTWSWVEFGQHFSPWGGFTKSFTDEHRFIFPKPTGITELSSICLRIEGAQTLPNGQEVAAAGGTTCHIPEVEVVMDVPSWWEPVTVPVWLPDLPEDVLLKDAIAGHISVQTDTPRKDELTQNALVWFADLRAPHPLGGLEDALARVERPNATLRVIVVVPPGAFDNRRKELETKLALAREHASTRLHVTEDAEGGWTRTFGATKLPSIYLINARRQFVWKHEGAPDPALLAAALNEHLLPAPSPRARPLRLAASIGDRAPDVFFHDGASGSALHRLRGQPVLLNFWQSWSAPCLKELRRLQGLHEQREGAPFIVAFHGGKDTKALDAIRKQLGLSFALVQDTDQEVARRYGVRCWPTTIRISADGRVEHIQSGISHEHRPASGYSKAESA